MAARSYVVDVEHLDACFPLDMPPPRLLHDFAAWLATQPDGSLGSFTLVAESVTPEWTGDDLATEGLTEAVGIFMNLPDGSNVGLWKQPEHAPVTVLMGSEGDLDVLAPDLDTFLLALARRDTGLADLDPGDEELDSSARAASAALNEWLAARRVEPSERKVHPSAFRAWVEAVVAQAKATPVGSRTKPLQQAPLPENLFDRVEPLLGLTTREPAVADFFEGIGIDLTALRGPDDFRWILRPHEGVIFVVDWAYSRAAQGALNAAQRAAMVRQRERAFLGLTFCVVPQVQRLRDERGDVQLEAYTGALPFGIVPSDDPAALASKLGAPTTAYPGGSLWDDPARGRRLFAEFDLRAAQPSLKLLRWTAC